MPVAKRVAQKLLWFWHQAASSKLLPSGLEAPLLAACGDARVAAVGRSWHRLCSGLTTAGHGDARNTDSCRHCHLGNVTVLPLPQSSSSFCFVGATALLLPLDGDQ